MLRFLWIRSWRNYDLGWKRIAVEVVTDLTLFPPRVDVDRLDVLDLDLLGYFLLLALVVYQLFIGPLKLLDFVNIEYF